MLSCRVKAVVQRNPCIASPQRFGGVWRHEEAASGPIHKLCVQWVFEGVSVGFISAEASVCHRPQLPLPYMESKTVIRNCECRKLILQKIAHVISKDVACLDRRGNKSAIVCCHLPSTWGCLCLSLCTPFFSCPDMHCWPPIPCHNV